MKLTEEKLRRLIREELSLNEVDNSLAYQLINEAYDLLEEATYELYDSGDKRKVRNAMKNLTDFL